MNAAAWTSRRTIDITPGARWRRTGRVLLAGALLTIALPLLWLLGGLAMLGLMTIAVAVPAASAARHWWNQHRSAGRPIDTAGLR